MTNEDSRFVVNVCEPAYLAPGRLEQLRQRALQARAGLRACHGCPRDCGVDRLAEQTGTCQINRNAHVSSAFPHLGEESCLRGRRGSGTIFFSGCNLRCVFCQNDDISQRAAGRAYDAQAIAEMMLALQEQGCHNINLVTPTHVLPWILEALAVAIAGGLRLPIVYNTGAYDSLESLRLLDGIVDIYMPDFKVWSEAAGQRYLLASDYGRRARVAIVEMHRQVGDLRCTADGIAARGLLVRHLVMPGLGAESVAILRWLAESICADTFVNIMGQYRPSNQVNRTTFSEINRPVTAAEMSAAYRAAKAAGLWRFDH